MHHPSLELVLCISLSGCGPSSDKHTSEPPAPATPTPDADAHAGEESAPDPEPPALPPDATPEQLAAACEAEHFAACYRLGDALLFGHGIAKDQPKGAALFEKACNGGLLSACHDFAVLLDQGVGVTRDEARANVLYERNCNANIGISCVMLAVNVRSGHGVAEDPARALALYEHACSTARSTQGCHEAGAAYLDGELVVRDEARAAAYLQIACDQGNPYACGQLGELALAAGDGHGTALVDKACGAGDRDACFLHALILIDGLDGQARDLARADALLASKCADSPLAACKAVVKPLTDSKADRLLRYQAICDHRVAPACLRAAELIADGEERVRLYRQACQLSNATGCLRAAEAFEQGRDTDVDPEFARDLRHFACRLGERSACGD